MIELFITFVYQPFLNILVGIYWLMGALTTQAPDMGVAVILFTVVLRILLLPLALSQERSEAEKKILQTSAKALEEAHASQPMVLRAELKKLMHKNRRIVLAEFVDLAIQIIIALMLWRLFARGLTGEDLHYIYSWMPKVETPFNLKFLGVYDLTHPNLFLTFVQSLLIFLLEVMDVLRTPIKVSKYEVVKYQLLLPVVSFFIFLFLPAGKKLFIITTLLFSIGFRLFRIIQEGIKGLGKRMSEPAVEVKKSTETHKESGSGTHAGHSLGATESQAHFSHAPQSMQSSPSAHLPQGQVWVQQGGMYYSPTGFAHQPPHQPSPSGNPHPTNPTHQPHPAPPVHSGGYATHHLDGKEHYGESHAKKEPQH